MDPQHARLELARRYLHILGPATAAAFAYWAGIQPTSARSALEALAGELTPVRTPVGDAWILADDEAAFRLPYVWNSLGGTGISANGRFRHLAPNFDSRLGALPEPTLRTLHFDLVSKL
jgi:hypothetical protein